MIRFLLACAILVALAPAARADSLLGSFSTFMGVGGDAPPSSIQAISFEIGYDRDVESPPCVRIRIGCEPIPLAQLVPGATFTFDAGHGAHFSQVASYLTNGIDEPVWYVLRAWGARGAIVSGGGTGGQTESATFHLVPAIQTYTITRIVLTIDAFAIGDQSICNAPPVGHCYKATFTWRIYGDLISTPAQRTSWGALKSVYR
jgi:hypothetical protein